LVFCFQEQYSLFGNFNNTPVINMNPKYWGSKACTFIQSTSGNVDVHVQLSMVPYALAVFVKNATKTNFTQVSFTIGTADDSCNALQTANFAGVCMDVKQIENHAKVDVPLGLSAFHFALVPSNNLTEFITIYCKDNTTELDFWIRRDGTPAVGGMMGKCPGEPKKIPAPRFGLFGYYLLVENKLNKTQDLSLDFTLCGSHMGGEGCNQTILNASTVSQMMLLHKNIYYFKINATTKNPVWVSVRRINGTQMNVVNPLIFASLNQIPTLTNADIGGCNQFYCDLVNVIHFNVTENQTWYIGIANSDEKFNGTTAGVWFNSVCAPDCADHGTCNDMGPQMGFCDCIDGFIGVDCQLPNGFGPQFIVLIIIAVLVALTAVIGFGAWAYMKRKRGQYDIVS